MILRRSTRGGNQSKQVSPNNGMQWTALRAAADAHRFATAEEEGDNAMVALATHV